LPVRGKLTKNAKKTKTKKTQIRHPAHTCLRQCPPRISYRLPVSVLESRGGALLASAEDWRENRERDSRERAARDVLYDLWISTMSNKGNCIAVPKDAKALAILEEMVAKGQLRRELAGYMLAFERASTSRF